MMNDTVREELATKITSGELPRLQRAEPVKPPLMPQPPRPAMIAPQPPVRKTVTANLSAPKTSPTLVEFQTKSASLPDWRLQLQNAVQARKGGHAVQSEGERSFPTRGGAALKAEVVAVPAEAQAAPATTISDPRVAAAMRRIDSSRQRFAESASPKAAAPRAPQRSFPFDVVPGGDRKPMPARAHSVAVPNASPKPKLVVPPPATELKRDTNKLPPITALPEKIEKVVPVEESIESRPVESVPSGKLPAEFSEIKRIRIKAENIEIETEVDAYEDEIEDLAPVSMRFCAGLFDLIIGGFISMAALAPFALNGGDWFTTSGLLIAVAAWGLVMFLYMTISLGLVGKTMGMRLFSLELVDAVENEYPTLQQAAISSSVFLLSLGLAGSGFLTLFYNEERRALHDLLSGTILVREF